nr:MAG TPA: hypothetical protein [Caudoviricetes sp.]
MNESYEQELQTEINFLLHEVGYLQEEISNARASGDTDEYTRLFRVFLPVQKQYLKLCAELEKLTGANVDELAAFNGA